MRRWIVIGLVGLLTFFGVAGAAAPARAAVDTEVRKPNIEAWIYLGKSQGHLMSISMPNPRVAVLAVYKLADRALIEAGIENFAQTVYAARPSPKALEKGRIRASFPSLGKVSLRFEPSGKRQVHRASRGCRGKRGLTEFGTFRGTISLEGEDGYFRVKARARQGLLSRSFRRVCKKSEIEQEDPSAPLSKYVTPGFGLLYSPEQGTVALLYAFADQGNRSIAFRAAHDEGASPGAEVQLGVLEKRPGMAIGRSAFASGGRGTLTTSMPGVHPAFAAVAPPPPFSGEGNFLENSSTSHSWIGTLGVSLPGLDLPLTGEEFRTSLCVVSPLKAPAGCDFIKPKPVRGARVWGHP